MIKNDDVYMIGRIGRPHGVKGEVTFRFADDVFDRVDCDYLILSIDGILVPFFIEEYRFHGAETAIVKFCDIDTKDRAAALTGCEVYFPRSLAEAGGTPLSLSALVGYALIDAGSGREVGRVASIDDSTANVLFVTDGGVLVPAADELIVDINTETKEIITKLPEGLLDI